jgi:protein involved in polysaccharide export with SLBB domain
VGLALASSRGFAADTQLPGLDTGIAPRQEETTPIEPRTSVVTGPVDPATYVVGPGDVIELHFVGALSQTIPVTVSPEGTGYVRAYGTVKLAGLTLEQARREIRRVIGADIHRGVQIDIELVRVRMLRVFPTGEVTAAGSTEVPATARLSDALDGGKLVAPTGSRRTIEVRHRDGSVEVADLERYLRLGDTRANPLLRDDDVIHVPPSREFVDVEGAVAHVLHTDLRTDDSLHTLLELSGGAVTSARRDRALFIRWNSPTARESLWVGLDEIESRRFNPTLRDGDRLLVYYLPEYHRLESATILGEVTSPGVYPLQPGVTRLSDLVHLAGGFQPRADLSAIRVYRPNRAAADQDIELERLSRLSRNEMTNSEYDRLRTRLTQRRDDFRVDWNRLVREPAEDIVLVSGDVVRVDPTVAAVRVEGEVRRPGLVRYAPGTSLARYIADAGGYSARAAGGRTLVTRAVTGQTLPAREVSQIEPGDMIWVPERPDRTIWQNLGTLIAVSAQVATLIIAVRR